MAPADMGLEETEAAGRSAVKRAQWLWLGATAIAILVWPAVGLLTGNGAIGGAATVGASLVLVLPAFLAWRSAVDASKFGVFVSYAQTRGLTMEQPTQDVPPLTPLLRRGETRIIAPVLRGDLGKGTEGTIAHLYFNEKTPDPEAEMSMATEFHYLVVFLGIAGAADRAGKIYCRPRDGTERGDKVGNRFLPPMIRRATLESSAFNLRFDLFLGKEQDDPYVRRLFSPSFVVWLTEAEPPKLGFEIENGNLCCFLQMHEAHLPNGTTMDALMQTAAEIAKRMQDETAE